MTDTLSRLAGPISVGSGTTTVFTGTAAHTYTIRNWRIVNNTGGAVTARVGIGGVTDTCLIFPAMSIPAASILEDDGMVVMSGTETLQVSMSASGTTITVSGLDHS